jgi:phenylpropionate dioxygenase-like ring-hydroxylating dioxygenase large terminal subunit
MINNMRLLIILFCFIPKLQSFRFSSFLSTKKSKQSFLQLNSHFTDINNINDNTFLQFGKNPRLEQPNDNGRLTWYPIGFDNDFTHKAKQITIRDVNYAVWKSGYKETTKYYAIRDACSHQGSSFIHGRTYSNKITCPYHGYIFNGTNGALVKIPKMKHDYNEKHNIQSFQCIEKGGVIYMNTVPLSFINKTKTMAYIDPTIVFIEPEYTDSNHKSINLEKEFNHYAKLVTVNSLDICHIGFVHSFGNKQQPNPKNIPKIESKIQYPSNSIPHFGVIYNYIAGKNSLVHRVYNYTRIQVENEYILPHTTVARVRFGEWSSTIITHALPISTFKTRLFVKAYRNYMYYDLTKCHDWSYPFKLAINWLGDQLTEDTMITTLNEVKNFIDNIDKHDYESIHGKFSITYDILSDHYKNSYAKYYETGPNQI